jgi:hypothetical protein
LLRHQFVITGLLTAVAHCWLEVVGLLLEAVGLLLEAVGLLLEAVGLLLEAVGLLLELGQKTAFQVL